mmetsp:Transcript_4015/g.5632  ORF Transcript_4015/g.5632 Transcript_4015/m.5632 type:complete len:914 (+) Transcript_4015:31-2772(+)
MSTNSSNRKDDFKKKKKLTSYFGSIRLIRNDSPKKKDNTKNPAVSSSYGYSPTSTKKIFGIQLEQNGKVPLIIEQLASHIERYGLFTEGIFRVSGQLSKVNALRDQYERGLPVDLSPFNSDGDMHVLAGLLKLYLREMPDPVLTFELYPAFIAANDITDISAKLECLKNLIQSLPLTYLAILNRLADLLLNIAKNSSLNKMTPSNLAIVIGPNILRAQSQTMEAIINDTPLVTKIIELIVKEAPYLLNKEPGNAAQAAAPQPQEQVPTNDDNIFEMKRRKSVVAFESTAQLEAAIYSASLEEESAPIDVPAADHVSELNSYAPQENNDELRNLRNLVAHVEPEIKFSEPATVDNLEHSHDTMSEEQPHDHEIYERDDEYHDSDELSNSNEHYQEEYVEEDTGHSEATSQPMQDKPALPVVLSQRLYQLNKLTEAAIEEIKSTLENVQHYLTTAVTCHNIDGILFIAKVVQAVKKQIAGDVENVFQASTLDLAALNASGLSSHQVTNAISQKVDRLNTAIRLSLADIADDLNTIKNEIRSTLQQEVSEEIAQSQMVQTVRLIRNIKQSLSCFQSPSLANSRQNSLASSHDAEEWMTESQKAAEHIQNSFDRMMERLPDMKALEEAIYLTQILRCVKQVTRYPRDSIQNFVIPEFERPTVQQSSVLVQDSKLNTFCSVIRLVLSEVKTDVDSLNKEVQAQSTTRESRLAILKVLRIVLKLVELIDEHTNDNNMIKISEQKDDRDDELLHRSRSSSFGATPKSSLELNATHSASKMSPESAAVDEKVRKLKEICNKAAENILIKLESLQESLLISDSISIALHTTQIVRNLKKLIDNPSENVEQMLVPSNRSVDIAQTPEALHKLNTLKKLCIPLFNEIRSAVDDIRNDVVNSQEIQVIADNARLLNNLKKVISHI